MINIFRNPVLFLSYLMYVIPCIVALIGIWIEVPRKPKAKFALTVFTVLLVVVSVRCKIMEYEESSLREEVKDVKIDDLQKDNENLKRTMDYIVSTQDEIKESTEFELVKAIGMVTLPTIGPRLVVSVHSDGSRTLLWDDGDATRLLLRAVVKLTESDIKVLAAHAVVEDYLHLYNFFCKDHVFPESYRKEFWNSEFRENMIACPVLMARDICDVVQVLCPGAGTTFRVDTSRHELKIHLESVSAPQIEQSVNGIETSSQNGVMSKWLVVNERDINSLIGVSVGIFGNRVAGLLARQNINLSFQEQNCIRKYVVTSDGAQTIHMQEAEKTSEKYWMGPNL